MAEYSIAFPEEMAISCSPLRSFCLPGRLSLVRALSRGTAEVSALTDGPVVSASFTGTVSAEAGEGRSCDSAPGARQSINSAQHAATIYLPGMLKRAFNRQVVGLQGQEYDAVYFWKPPQSHPHLRPLLQLSPAPP